MAMLTVPIVKAKTTLEVDLDKLPDEVYKEFMISGAKNVLGRGMSKITKAAYPDAEELKAAALEKAKENLEACYAGEIRITGAAKATKKVAGEVMAEARRRAKAIVKDALRAAGYKVSHYKAAAITVLANDYLDTEEGAVTIEEVKADLEAKKAKPAPKGLDLTKIKPDAKLVAAAEEKKSKAKKVPAGIVNAKGRQPGGAQARAH